MLGRGSGGAPVLQRARLAARVQPGIGRGTASQESLSALYCIRFEGGLRAVKNEISEIRAETRQLREKRKLMEVEIEARKRQIASLRSKRKTTT